MTKLPAISEIGFQEVNVLIKIGVPDCMQLRFDQFEIEEWRAAQKSLAK